jgi:mannose-6-phosphate isomerase class I
LLDIIRYDFKECPVLYPEAETGTTTYPTTAKEFEVTRCIESEGFHKKCISDDRPSIYLITQGTLDIEWKSGEESRSAHFKAGESFFLPASLPQFEISADRESHYFAVLIP